MNKKVLSLLLALVMVFAVVLSGCSKKSGETSTTGEGKTTEGTAKGDAATTEQGSAVADSGSEGGKTLRLSMSSDIPDLDPALVSDNQSSFVANQVFQTLVEVDLEGKVVGEAAESFEHNEDMTVWTFTLRDGLTFSNGDQITAEDFKYSWLRTLDPEVASGQASRLYEIVGAQAFNEGTGKAEEVGIEVKDPKTLVVTLTAGDAFFAAKAAYPVFAVVNKAVIESAGADWMTKPESYVGSGAYKLESYELGSSLTFVKNDKYYKADQVDVDRISVELIQDENTVYRKFMNGELDHVGTPVHSIAKDLMDEASKLDSYRQLPQLAIYWFKLNTEDQLLSNVHLRKALAYAIDRESLIKNITKGGQKPALGYVPQFESQYFKDNDVEAAKAELAKAVEELGVSDASQLKLSLNYNTNDNHQKIAQALQEQWKNSLGLNVELKNEEWQVHLQTINQGNYQIGRLGWGADIPDPADFLNMYMIKDDDNNATRWGSEAFNAKIEEANKFFDDTAKRDALLKEAEAIMIEDMPVIPLYFDTAPSLTNKDTVESLSINILGQLFVKDVKMK